MAIWKEHNAHWQGKYVGTDCMRRAICVASGVPYRTVEQKFFKMRKPAKLTHPNKRIKVTSREVMDEYAKDEGWEIVWIQKQHLGIDSDYDGLPTVEEFADRFPHGRWVVLVPGHATAVCSGAVFDTWDCRKELVRAVYAVRPDRFTAEDIRNTYCTKSRKTAESE